MIALPRPPEPAAIPRFPDTPRAMPWKTESRRQVGTISVLLFTVKETLDAHFRLHGNPKLPAELSVKVSANGGEKFTNIVGDYP